MKARSVSMIIAVALAVSAGPAFAVNYNDSPMVDVRPGQEQAYQEDLAQCRNLVESNQNSGRQAASRRGLKSGAMMGALGGAAVGRASGDKALRSAGKGAAWGAAAGGVAGHVAGDINAGVDSGYAVRRCLEGRGYNVLDYSREDRRADSGFGRR